ncbi:hypothetical protein KGM_203853 [Danaus plexippus plexippus]|uniref:Uncharacterized protein n=1 Tax=Danaus plexippus plexippus TaxID=278856 RepID=A0A212EIP9_DANPL|nr:hypothetical protein KGM_203853 [Danaus plexippus plexippus]
MPFSSIINYPIWQKNLNLIKQDELDELRAKITAPVAQTDATSAPQVNPAQQTALIKSLADHSLLMKEHIEAIKGLKKTGAEKPTTRATETKTDTADKRLEENSRLLRENNENIRALKEQLKGYREEVAAVGKRSGSKHQSE